MRNSCAITIILVLLSAAVGAQEVEDSLSKQLANPLAAMISVPTQINYDDDLGVGKNGSILQINVQPVLPFTLNGDWLLITRTILPFIQQKDLTPNSGEQTGFGDVLESIFFSPVNATESGWIWGAGPVFLLPTASEDELGLDQWAGGPTFVALKQEGAWTRGVLANHLWTLSNEDDKTLPEPFYSAAAQRGISVSKSSDISVSYVEPWVSFAAAHGTTYSISAECSYDWDASQWLIPVVLTADHLFLNGPIPFTIGAAARYWAESPDGGPEDWAARVQFTLLFPK